MKKNGVIYQVDAFTSDPFKGNPAGVCILDNEMPEEWMRNVAAEMNLSETAFILTGKKEYPIRYFTPEAEIPLCGHATLSSAHIMFETGAISKNEEISFISKAGMLIVRFSDGWINMNFPAYQLERIKIPNGIKEIIGIIPDELFRTEHGWSFAVLPDEKSVRNLQPDFRLMKNSEFGDLIVTATSDTKDFDFCVRCFAPVLGINEDPVTGSAHCALVPYWAERTGKRKMVSHQVSKRSGVLKVELKNDRVEISGQARTIFRADLFV
ncbi:MAG: PhzF family phenazine biosynthesis isomerase [Bacteroidales bacterium]|jgi:PhzF family phenazine biosynthesis protein